MTAKSTNQTDSEVCAELVLGICQLLPKQKVYAFSNYTMQVSKNSSGSKFSLQFYKDRKPVSYSTLFDSKDGELRISVPNSNTFDYTNFKEILKGMKDTVTVIDIT